MHNEREMICNRGYQGLARIDFPITGSGQQKTTARIRCFNLLSDVGANPGIKYLRFDRMNI